MSQSITCRLQVSLRLSNASSSWIFGNHIMLLQCLCMLVIGVMLVLLLLTIKLRSFLPYTVSILQWPAMTVMLAAGSQGHKLFATDCEHAYVACRGCDACCCSQGHKLFATDCEHAYVACKGCDACCCSQDERLLSSHQPVPCRIGTDDATGSMRRLYSRRCRDRPGVSIPALAIPRDGSKPEPVLIYFGIIDFLQVRLLY